MKIALISDVLTHDAFQSETSITVKIVTSLNYKMVLKLWMPDLLFVESAWQGYKNKWKYKIASYPDYPERNNEKLKKIVCYAKELGIPTVFWNKEDSVHFERFIDSAKLFDHIFTVDENCIPRYKEEVNKEVTVHSLMFAVQEQFHNFTGFNFKYNSANFVGSYSHHIHEKRRLWQDMMFSSASQVGIDVTVFDRNSNRKSKEYRYPNLENINIFSAVAYKNTAHIYKDHMLSLNVNTIEDSPTMFSRRLVEILACGGIAVTNPTVAVDKLFKEYCHVISMKEELDELFYRVHKYGLSERDKEMARAGALFVSKYHTWKNRFEYIQQCLEYPI